MTEVNSGTTMERVLRNAAFAGLVVLFAGWFLWDGYVGYSRENAAALVRSLGLDSTDILEVDPQLTADEARQLVDELTVGAAMDDVERSLGKPGLRREDEAYYVGPGGYIVIQLAHGRVGGAEWKQGPHSESDMQWQRRLGYVMALVGLVSIMHFFRVVTTRVSLTDAGLGVRGRPVIPFDAMTVLRTGERGDTGAVTIEYALAGRKGVVSLDSYVVKELPAIVTGICERAGFPHPGTSELNVSGQSDSPPERTEPPDSTD